MNFCGIVLTQNATAAEHILRVAHDAHAHTHDKNMGNPFHALFNLFAVIVAVRACVHADDHDNVINGW